MGDGTPTRVSPLLFVAAPSFGAVLGAVWWMPSHVGDARLVMAAIRAGIVSIVAFLEFVIDKVKARFGWWRTSENELLWARP